MAASKVKLLAIIGPTASGKTALSVDIAKRYNGEVIAADSRTVYKYMDIGTAKPSLTEQAGIAHWGFDLVGPGQKMTLANYKLYATEKIREVQKRHRLPVLVGGSGLYIDAVVYDFSLAPANDELRRLLSTLSIAELQLKIRSQGLKMPQNCQNKRYLIRTLERAGNNPSKKKLPKGTLIIGVNPDRETIKERIVKRAHQMINDGVINEIKDASVKYGWESEAMTGGIYKTFRPYLEGKITQEEAISRLVASDIRLVKKQLTWFKRNKDIKWFTSVKEATNWLDEQIKGKLG
jgi:tRNA dimethylallyltransferase